MTVSPSMSNINMHYETPKQVSTEIVTCPKLDIKLSVNSDKSDEEPRELAAEQNWRNKRTIKKLNVLI